MRYIIGLLTLLCGVSGISKFEVLEADVQYKFASISLAGTVVSDTAVIKGAKVRFEVDGTTTKEVETDDNGHFVMADMRRQNGLLFVNAVVNAVNMREEIVAVKLHRAKSTKEVVLEPVLLFPVLSGEARFFFGGDTSFGRRFVEPSSEHLSQESRTRLYINRADALVKAGDPETGAKDCLHFMKPYCVQADFCVLNLETAVIENTLDKLTTPHTVKNYVYRSLPESLEALHDFGANYVSMGNNHVYDYLEAGMQETLNELNAHNVKFSGAGMDVDSGLAPYTETIQGSSYSFLSANSVAGNRYGNDLNFNAGTLQAGESKGGAAPIDEAAKAKLKIIMAKVIADGGYPIFQLHTGKEYSFAPSDYSRELMNWVADQRPPVIITHHPHVAQGIARMGTNFDILTVQSLGNFNFDQARLDTMMAIHARLDMNGNSVNRLRIMPHYNEDYRPRPLTGYVADNFLRGLAEASRQAALDNGGGAVFVYPYLGQLMVQLDTTTASEAVSTKDRNITVEGVVDAKGEVLFDFRSYLSPDGGESVESVASTTAGIEAKFGRDILTFGDFEDDDVDDMDLEESRWDSSNDLFRAQAFRGVGHACLDRSATNSADARSAFRNRMRLTHDTEFASAPMDQKYKDVSITGHVKGINVVAGKNMLRSRYYASFGENVFNQEEFGESDGLPSGTFDWTRFHVDTAMPADSANNGEWPESPRAVRVFLILSPNSTAASQLCFDDLAVINWDVQAIATPATVATPHRADFLKVSAAGNTKLTPGSTVSLSVNLRRYKPALPTYTEPPPAPAVADPVLGLVSTSTCEAAGFMSVETSDQCNALAAEMGLKDIQSGSSGGRGCYYNLYYSQPNLYFGARTNLNTWACSEDRPCLCAPRPVERVTTDSCVQAGCKAITTAVECEAFATQLHLVDKLSTTSSSSTTPAGCYYRQISAATERLYFNTVGGSDCSVERNCLCDCS